MYACSRCRSVVGMVTSVPDQEGEYSLLCQYCAVEQVRINSNTLTLKSISAERAEKEKKEKEKKAKDEKKGGRPKAWWD